MSQQPRPYSFACALLAVLLISHVAVAQGTTTTLVLTVVDSATRAPVSGARVGVAGVARPEFTNASGVVRIGPISPGQRIVEVRRVGYALGRVALDFGNRTRLEHEIALTAVPIELEAVTAVAAQQNRALEQSGFYRRERTGLGSFLRTEQIERLRPMRTIDLFRYMRGFQVSVTPRGEPLLVTSRGPVGFGSGCIPHVYVDGMRLAPGPGENAAHMVNVIPPEHLAAVEAFSGPAQIPAQYNATGAACGVVLLWTRS
jgi:hypothetical protein